MKLRLLVLLILLSSLHGLGQSDAGAPDWMKERMVRIAGSDTMLVLTRLWAEEFMKTHSGISVYAQGGGTASGVKELIHSRIDLCAASRPLQADEVQELVDWQNSIGISIAVAKEALSVYVHSDNRVRDFSAETLREIFTGRITNWQELGGEDAQIITVIRSPNSGTHLYFKEHVLNEEPYSSAARVMSNTKAIVDAVSSHPYAIGYGGVAYGTGLHARVNGTAPTVANIRNNTYPITRYLYLITASTPRGPVKTFVDWTLSSEGQKAVNRAGYVSLW
jgi:phosphate transport system substrate-binding protein